MRHQCAHRKFNRTKDQRKALFRCLANGLIKNKSIKSTLPKCKDLRPYVEKLVTIAKENTLHARRLLLSKLGNQVDTVDELIKFAVEKCGQRPGGYLRVLKAGFRVGDNAPMGIIQFVDHDITLKA